MIAVGSILYIGAKPFFTIRLNATMGIGAIPYVEIGIENDLKICIFRIIEYARIEYMFNIRVVTYHFDCLSTG